MKREGMCKPGEVDQLVTQLARPIFNLRMGRGREHASGRVGRSGRTQADLGRQEIHDIVVRYVKESR